MIMTSEDYLDAFEKLIRFVIKLLCTLVQEEVTRRVVSLPEPLLGWFLNPSTFSVQDGPEGQAGEGDSSCSDGLLPSGANL